MILVLNSIKLLNDSSGVTMWSNSKSIYYKQTCVPIIIMVFGFTLNGIFLKINSYNAKIKYRILLMLTNEAT
jgi:hypothetical protein